LKKSCLDIVPIIVTFNPDKIRLLACLRALLPQVKSIVIVDNGSCPNFNDVIQNLELAKPNCIKLLIQRQNYGLGKAYNIGIDIARDLKVAFVLLMDQDSIPEPDMLHALRSAHIYLENQGKKVGAVGPRYRHHATTEASDFVRLGQFRFIRGACEEQNDLVQADFLISSGSLISLNALNAIGGMDEDLFIDHIDTEWCFRAQSKGFKLYGVCSAVMQHSLGEQRIRLWFGRWRTIAYHQPFRYYYMFRNSVLLWQRSYMSTVWKRADKLRILSLFIFFTLFSSNRIANLRMMLKGLNDGFNRRTGKL